MSASPYLRRRASALAVFVSLVALALLAVPGSSSGARPARQHVVQPGETLWAIAGAAYGGDTDSHVQAIAREVKAGTLRPEQIDEACGLVNRCFFGHRPTA